MQSFIRFIFGTQFADSVQATKMYFLGAQQGTNTCARNRGGCQHLCLAVSNVAHVCKCAIGYTQDATNATRCVGKDEFVLYSIMHELKGIDLYSKDVPIEHYESSKVSPLKSSTDAISLLIPFLFNRHLAQYP